MEIYITIYNNYNVYKYIHIYIYFFINFCIGFTLNVRNDPCNVYCVRYVH